MLLLALAAFVSGSIPFGLLIGLAKGVDVRRAGSGNIGATNVGRVLSRRYFWLCFILDFLKGFVPTLIAGRVMGGLGVLALEPAASGRWLLVMLAAVLGHVFSPWLGFKGGKGVATAVGAMVGVFPALTVPAACVVVVFGVVLAAKQYVSLAAMAGACSLPLWIAAWFHLASIGVGPHGAGVVRPVHMMPFLGVGVVLAVLVVVRHRSNIARLRAGTEPKIGRRAADQGPRVSGPMN